MRPAERWKGASCAVLLAALLASDVAPAAVDRRLSERLDPATAQAVKELIEGAEADGIPSDPLIATALEGASKRASGERIVAAVRRHVSALSTARQALGNGSTSAELVAGAGALISGVPADTLARLRLSRPQGSVVVPLVVLADLITRQVPIATASGAITQAARFGARDTDLLRLRARVEGDIQRGVSPGAAMLARLQGLGLNGLERGPWPSAKGERPLRGGDTP